MIYIDIKKPIKLISVANSSETHYERARRVKVERTWAGWQMRVARPIPPRPPLRITMTRFGRGVLDTDNLPSAFKAVRDGISDWLRVDDGSPQLQWICKQVRQSAPPECQIVIEDWADFGIVKAGDV